MKRFFYLLLFSILFYACADYIDECETRKITPTLKRLSASDSTLTSTDASIVALIEKYGTTSTKSNNTDEIDEIIPLYSDNGEIIMYAVNFKSGGYTVVSATKDYFPILVRAETGRFTNAIFETGASVLFNGYKQTISHNKTLSKDSLQDIRDLWMIYEEPHKGNRTATKADNDDLFDLVDASINEWNAAGISYWFLNEGKPNHLPDNIYQQYLSYAQTFSNPEFDYLTNCVIIGIPFQHTSQQAPLLSTAWHQWAPFNSGLSQDWPIGCCAVALGQVMAYHQFPTLWDWNNILSLGNKIGNFMYTIAVGINTNFSDTLSGSNINNVKNYLDEIGYNVQKVSHSTSYVTGSLGANRPVIMFGFNSNKGHAWVCDGRESSNSQITYKLLILSITEPLQYEQGSEQYVYQFSATPTRYHMNWGWRGGNGYYEENSWYSSPGYPNNRQDLIHIYPE